LNDQNQNQARATDFSLAFQQIASFVAISKTKNPAEVREQLILLCFVVLPKERFSNASELMEAIGALFGIQIPLRQIEISFKSLLAKSAFVELPGDQLGLAPVIRERLEKRLSEARGLEQAVKTRWFEQISRSFPIIPCDQAWDALKDYLNFAFRRHGIQTVALLDSSLPLNQAYAESFSSMLRSVIEKHFPQTIWDTAKQAVASFLATVNIDRQRAEYISQLADSAFNYFSLTVPPEVSEQLRKKLSQLTLFLDTNFLFGILKLHVHPQVDVSTELLDTCKRFNLPFKFNYHEATVREMRNTLYHFTVELKKYKWSQHISRAAVASGAMTGIELKYHQSNAEQRLDVDDFFAPYKHWEIVLKEKGINVFNMASTAQSLARRADLEADYKEFLKNNEKEKPDDAIQHDMAVLETVRNLRSKTKNTLEAGALLVTCDYYLYRFDWDNSEREGKQSCTVLPSLLWQMLRPYITDNIEFDKAFAETFALPEFSAFAGGAAKAASKMLSILTGYKELNEETATKMLSNDLLLAQLQTKKNDDEFIEAVDSALASENHALIEEKAALSKQLETQKADKLESDRQIASAAEIVRQQAEAIQTLEAEKQSERSKAEEISRQFLNEQRDKEAARQEAQRLLLEKQSIEMRTEKNAKIGSVILGILIAVVFELAVNFVVPWKWLLTHQNSYVLQGSISMMIFFGTVGFGVKKWRNVVWLIGFFGVLFVILASLGGPPAKH